MINEDVRHIIEPELAEGEELLWAEIVDGNQVEAFVQSRVLSDKLWMPIMFIMAVIFAFVVFSAFPLEYEGAMGLIGDIVGIVFVTGLSLLMLFCVKEMAASYKSNAKYADYYKLFGYALTRKRFLVVQDKAVAKTMNVTRPKVWKRTKRRDLFRKIISHSIMIDHDDNNLGFNTIELKFLHNAEQSSKYLEALIGKTK